MGTAAYMAPEQARGHEVATILDCEPALVSLKADMPQELQRVLTKCLRKERTPPYHVIRDLLVDLYAARSALIAEPRCRVGGWRAWS